METDLSQEAGAQSPLAPEFRDMFGSSVENWGTLWFPSAILLFRPMDFYSSLLLLTDQ